jgi:hypothetical protein
MASRHRRADLEGGLEAWIVIASGGATITRASGPNMQDADITCVGTGTGDYALTINPFKGPKGEAYAVANAMTISMMVSVTALTYTNDSLAVTLKIENDASTPSDAAVIVHLFAE